MNLSISFRTSTKMTSIKHNNRDLTDKEFQEPAHKHINQNLSGDNLYLKQENLKQVYNQLFGEVLQEYNEKQKRKDRKIDDFYHHVKQSKTLDLQREFIVGLGSKEDWDSMTREDKLQAGEKLAEYVKEFSDRHPHLYVYNAAVHLDEAGAPHAHFNVVPVATGYKNGLKAKPSFKRALANEGYKDNGRTLLKNFRDGEVKELERKLIELGHQRKEVGTNDIKDLHEYKRIVGQATKDLEEKLIKDYGAPEYINETTGEFYDLIEYHNFTEFPREEDEGQIARKTTIQEKINWLENRFEQIDRQFWELDEEVYHLETQKQVLEKLEIPEIEKSVANKKAESNKLSERISDLKRESERLSERIIKLERAHREETHLLLEQSDYLKGISFQDLDRRQEAQELHEELSLAKPKRFGDGFTFTNKFVDRLRTFMSDVTEKLEQTINQNEFLRRSLKGMTESKKLAENKLAEKEWDNQRLLTENQFLKQENQELKRSKTLLEDIQEVITDKEVDSINKRLKTLERSREASRGWDTPSHSKGRSI